MPYFPPSSFFPSNTTNSTNSTISQPPFQIPTYPYLETYNDDCISDEDGTYYNQGQAPQANSQPIQLTHRQPVIYQRLEQIYRHWDAAFVTLPPRLSDYSWKFRTFDLKDGYIKK
jgi:hypothetical protein